MVINIFTATSFFNLEEDQLDHDRGLTINLKTGSISHCLDIEDWEHNYTEITRKRNDGTSKEIIITSLSSLPDEELSELREEYGYVSEDEDENDTFDEYSGGYRSKFD